MFDGMQAVNYQLDTLRGKEVLGGLIFEPGRGPTSRLEGGTFCSSGVNACGCGLWGKEWIVLGATGNFE